MSYKIKSQGSGGRALIKESATMPVINVEEVTVAKNNEFEAYM